MLFKETFQLLGKKRRKIIHKKQIFHNWASKKNKSRMESFWIYKRVLYFVYRSRFFPVLQSVFSTPLCFHIIYVVPSLKYLQNIWINWSTIEVGSSLWKVYENIFNECCSTTSKRLYNENIIIYINVVFPSRYEDVIKISF